MDSATEFRKPHWSSALWPVLRPFVNATLVLAIVLVLAALSLVHSTRSFVDDTLADVKIGLLREIDKDAETLIADLRIGAAEYDKLQADIAALAQHPDLVLDPETRRSLRQIESDTHRIATDLDRIASGHIDLSQKTLERMAMALVRAYGESRREGETHKQAGAGFLPPVE